jgi:hypothetical protein
MAKKVQFTTNQPSSSTDYLAADNTWKTMTGGSGATWGSITGTLSSQTDLQTALDSKMNIATYDTDVDGVVDSAERIQIVVRNSTGITLTKGQIVYLSGATGNRPNAVLAQADTEATSSKTIGMVIANIPNNTDGQIAVNGTLHDIDTSAFSAGDTLWLSATTAGGVVANTPPSEPNHSVFIGYVARSHPTLGRIVLAIQNGYELDELHGVKITSVANNDILKYNSSNGLWENSNALSTKEDTITGAATTITSSNLTPSRALVSNGGGKVDVSAVTTTELGRLSGVTSDIQTQLDGKQQALTLTTTGSSGAATLGSGILNIPQYAGAGSGTSIQTITGVATGLGAATTRYNTINGSTSESQVSIPLASACTMNNLYVRTTATMPVNSSLQVTLVKNGTTPTALSVTIAAGSAAGIYSDTTNNATYSAGDRYQIEFKNTGSAVAAPTSGQSFKITI